jgi:invasion protein IalB
MMYQGWTILCQSPEKDGKECCGSDEVSGTKNRAKEEFQRSGWKRIKGKWHCPDCVEEAK